MIFRICLIARGLIKFEVEEELCVGGVHVNEVLT